MQSKGSNSMSKKDQQILGKGTLGQNTNEPLRTLKLNTSAASPDNSDSKSKFSISSSRARSLMALQTKEVAPSKAEDAPPVPVLADTDRTVAKRAAVALRSSLKERVFQTVLKGFGDPSAKWDFLRKNVAEMFNREKRGGKCSLRCFTIIMAKLLLTSVLPVKDLEKCALLDGEDEVSSGMWCSSTCCMGMWCSSTCCMGLCSRVRWQVLVDELLESVFGEGVPSTPSARAAMNAHATAASAAAADIHGA